MRDTPAITDVVPVSCSISFLLFFEMLTLIAYGPLEANEGNFMLQPGVNGVAWILAPCLALIYGRNTTGWTCALSRARSCLLLVSYLHNGYIKAPCHSQKSRRLLTPREASCTWLLLLSSPLSPGFFCLLLAMVSVTGLIFGAAAERGQLV